LDGASHLFNSAHEITTEAFQERRNLRYRELRKVEFHEICHFTVCIPIALV
jgi:hypothetical protein